MEFREFAEFAFFLKNEKIILIFLYLEYFEPNIEFNSTYVHMVERKFRKFR